MNLFNVLCVGNKVHQLRSLKNDLAPFGVDVTTALYGMDAEIQFESGMADWGSVVICDDLLNDKGILFAGLVREKGFQGRMFVLSDSCESTVAAAYSRLHICGVWKQALEMSVIATLLLQSD